MYQLDETSVPEAINRALGPDPFWEKGENIMCFDDLEVGLDETNDLKTVRYFGLYPGKTSKGEIRLPNHDGEKITRKVLQMGSVVEYLMINSVGFDYDKRLTATLTVAFACVMDLVFISIKKRESFILVRCF